MRPWVQVGAVLLCLLLAGCNNMASRFAIPGGPSTEAGAGALGSAPGATPNSDSQDASPTPRKAWESTSKSIETELLQLKGAFPGSVQIDDVQKHLDEVLRQVQQAGPQPPVPARIALVGDASYNVVTSHNGVIRIDIGVLKDIGSHSELVAWVAHEYGHLALGHVGGYQAVVSRVILEGQTILEHQFANGKTGAMTALAAGAASGVWKTVLRPAWSRSQEFDADKFALEAARALGYTHASSTKRFLERVRSIERHSAGLLTPTEN